MTKIDEGIYKWDKRTTHKFVGGLWPSFESHGGAFDGLHMFGGREPPRGQEKFNGSQRELLMAVSRGQNGSAQDRRRENITGSQISTGGVLQFQSW